MSQEISISAIVDRVLEKMGHDHGPQLPANAHTYKAGDKACSNGNCNANVVCHDCGHALGIAKSPASLDVLEAVKDLDKCPFCNGENVDYWNGPQQVCKDGDCPGQGHY